MSAPEIIGEPAIKQEGSSVLMEVVVKEIDVASIKWTKDDKELEADNYKLTTRKADDGNTVVCGQILNFDKPLAGKYKVDFTNSNGKNHCNFNVTAGNAPEFSDKPHIAQRDGGAIIVIKCRGKSPLPITVQWLKDEKPVELTDRVKAVVAKDNKDPLAFQYNLEIHGPQTSDEGKYSCVLKNAEGQNSQSLNLCFS